MAIAAEYPDQLSDVELSKATTGHDPAVQTTIASLRLPQLDLRLMFDLEMLASCSATDLVTQIEDRMLEAAQLGAILTDRLETARTLAEEAAASDNCGMQMISVSMAPLLATSRLESNQPLVAMVRMLNHSLQPVAQPVTGSDAHEIALGIQSYIPGQRRCVRRLARYATANAVVEIDAFAERLLQLTGHSVGETASILLSGAGHLPLTTPEEEGAMPMAVTLIEGRIEVVGSLSMEAPSAMLVGSEIRVFDPMEASLMESFVGRPASALVTHPVLPPSAIISAARVQPGPDGSEGTSFKLQCPRRLLRASDLQGG